MISASLKVYTEFVLFVKWRHSRASLQTEHALGPCRQCEQTVLLGLHALHVANLGHHVWVLLGAVAIGVGQRFLRDAVLAV